MAMQFMVEDEDGNEIPLPAKYEVCSRCDGKGSHVNENIDGNGITSSEWAEMDDDFREDYMSGMYDVQCSRCHGLRVELIVDEENLTSEQKELYKNHCDSLYSAAMDRRYARMESGD